MPSNSGGSVDTIGSRVRDSGSPQLDFTHFATPNIAFNLIAASTRHDIGVTGSAMGRTHSLGHAWALPTTLTLRHHPLPTSRISPDVGAGINYTFFRGHGGGRDPIVNRVRVDSAPGFALVAGMDYEIAPNWLADVDTKKVFLRPRASVNSGGIGARGELDPLIVGASIRYRF